MDCSREQALAILAGGGILLYPTETFWAIGGCADNAKAVQAIFIIKQRSPFKPLPLLAASMEQAAQYADLEAAPEELLRRHWPGPLTLVLPARRPLPAGLVNQDGKIAVRVTCNAQIARLCALSGNALVATSANLSGERPPHARKDLGQDLLAACRRAGLPWGILSAAESMAPAVVPSTIVEPVLVDETWKINIIRHGAIPASQLHSDKWKLS